MNVAGLVAGFTHRLSGYLQESLRKTQADVLQLIVEAALRGRSVKSAVLGRNLPTPFSFATRAQRVGRYLGNHRIRPDFLVPLILRLTRPLRKGGRVVILVDWTPLGSFQILTSAIGVAGRAVPLFWKVARRRLDDCTSQNDIEELFLLRLQELIPRHYEWVVVFDRGFGRADLFQFMQDNGIPYVVRVTGDAKVTHGKFTGPLQKCGLRFGQTWVWTDCEYRSKKRVRTKLVLHWNDPKGAPSYWFLATNLPLRGSVIVRIYEMRMWIEESFRDEKWDICLKEARITGEGRLERLFLVLALTVLISAWTGQMMSNRSREVEVSKPDHRKRAMSIFRIGLEFIFRHIFMPRPPVLFPISGSI